MDFAGFFNVVVGCAVGALGFFLKGHIENTARKIEGCQEKLQELELKMAKDHVTKSDFKEFEMRLMDAIRELKETINNGSA